MTSLEPSPGQHHMAVVHRSSLKSVRPLSNLSVLRDLGGGSGHARLTHSSRSLLTQSSCRVARAFGRQSPLGVSNFARCVRASPTTAAAAGAACSPSPPSPSSSSSTETNLAGLACYSPQLQGCATIATIATIEENGSAFGNRPPDRAAAAAAGLSPSSSHEFADGAQPPSGVEDSERYRGSNAHSYQSGGDQSSDERSRGGTDTSAPRQLSGPAKPHPSAAAQPSSPHSHTSTPNAPNAPHSPSAQNAPHMLNVPNAPHAPNSPSTPDAPIALNTTSRRTSNVFLPPSRCPPVLGEQPAHLAQQHNPQLPGSPHLSSTQRLPGISQLPETLRLPGTPSPRKRPPLGSVRAEVGARLKLQDGAAVPSFRGEGPDERAETQAEKRSVPGSWQTGPRTSLLGGVIANLLKVYVKKKMENCKAVEITVGGGNLELLSGRATAFRAILRRFSYDGFAITEAEARTQSTAGRIEFNLRGSRSGKLTKKLVPMEVFFSMTEGDATASINDCEIARDTFREYWEYARQADNPDASSDASAGPRFHARFFDGLLLLTTAADEDSSSSLPASPQPPLPMHAPAILAAGPGGPVGGTSSVRLNRKLEAYAEVTADVMVEAEAEAKVEASHSKMLEEEEEHGRWAGSRASSVASRGETCPSAPALAPASSSCPPLQPGTTPPHSRMPPHTAPAPNGSNSSTTAAETEAAAAIDSRYEGMLGSSPSQQQQQQQGGLRGTRGSVTSAKAAAAGSAAAAATAAIAGSTATATATATAATRAAFAVHINPEVANELVVQEVEWPVEQQRLRRLSAGGLALSPFSESATELGVGSYCKGGGEGGGGGGLQRKRPLWQRVVPLPPDVKFKSAAIVEGFFKVHYTFDLDF